MALPTTGLYLNVTDPAAPTGNQNIVFESDNGTPEQAVTAYPQQATEDLLGVVKPDGTTVTIGPDGTITANQSDDTAFIEAVQQQLYIFGPDTGTVNAYAVTQTPAPTVQLGSIVVTQIANSNTGPSTLSLDGGTATEITLDGVTPLSGGELPAGKIAQFVYDGSTFQILGGVGSGGSGGGGNPEQVVPSGPINGTNPVFILPIAPIAGSGNLYKNGVWQNPFGATPDYTLSGVTITMAVAPVSSPTPDWLAFTYVSGTTGSGPAGPPGPTGATGAPGAAATHAEPLTDGNANFIFAASLTEGGDIIVVVGVPN